MYGSLNFKWKIEHWIPDETKEELSEAALNRATEMLKEGFTSGELHHQTEDGETFHGWWNYEEV